MKANEMITMSQKEVDRLKVLEKVLSKKLSQIEAARILGLSTRQVRNLRRSYEREGVKGLVSKRRGKPSNHRLGEELKKKAMGLIKERYVDFGPTLAQEKLVEVHGLSISVESVRQEMI